MCLVVVCTNDGRQSKEIHTRIAKGNAVLREFFSSGMRKQELSNIEKLPVFESAFVPVLN